MAPPVGLQRRYAFRGPGESRQKIQAPAYPNLGRNPHSLNNRFGSFDPHRCARHGRARLLPPRIIACAAQSGSDFRLGRRPNPRAIVHLESRAPVIALALRPPSAARWPHRCRLSTGRFNPPALAASCKAVVLLRRRDGRDSQFESVELKLHVARVARRRRTTGLPESQ